MPIPLAITAAAIPSLYKTGAGFLQTLQGKIMGGRNTRPTYEIPEQVLENQRLAQREYTDPRLPGQSIMEDQLRNVTGTGVGQAKNVTTSSGDLIDAVTRLSSLEGRNINDLNLEGARKQERDLANLMNTNDVLAEYQDRKFDYNQNQPFQDNAAAASAMIGAGNQNVFSGLDTLGALAQSATSPGGALYKRKTLTPTSGTGTYNPSSSPWITNKLR